jgi:hypothetical protein
MFRAFAIRRAIVCETTRQINWPPRYTKSLTATNLGCGFGSMIFLSCSQNLVGERPFVILIIRVLQFFAQILSWRVTDVKYIGICQHDIISVSSRISD